MASSGFEASEVVPPEGSGHGDRERGEALVLELVGSQADSLLRVARRYSMCADDAHDAYQARPGDPHAPRGAPGSRARRGFEAAEVVPPERAGRRAIASAGRRWSSSSWARTPTRCCASRGATRCAPTTPTTPTSAAWRSSCATPRAWTPSARRAGCTRWSSTRRWPSTARGGGSSASPRSTSTRSSRARRPRPRSACWPSDRVARSAEALHGLKPQEVRALWLKALGHSYEQICEATGWTYTKVNRCLAEGRKSFLERYAGIESGQECERLAPTLSAFVDGEADAAQTVALRAHLRQCLACRAAVRGLHDASQPLAVVFPATGARRGQRRRRAHGQLLRARVRDGLAAPARARGELVPARAGGLRHRHGRQDGRRGGVGRRGRGRRLRGRGRRQLRRARPPGGDPARRRGRARCRRSRRCRGSHARRAARSHARSAGRGPAARAHAGRARAPRRRVGPQPARDARPATAATTTIAAASRAPQPRAVAASAGASRSGSSARRRVRLRGSVT